MFLEEIKRSFCQEKNETNNIITDFDEEYKTKLTEFLRMYYDPAFECYSWADINEFVDSDDDEQIDKQIDYNFTIYMIL